MKEVTDSLTQPYYTHVTATALFCFSKGNANSDRLKIIQQFKLLVYEIRFS